MIDQVRKDAKYSIMLVSHILYGANLIASWSGHHSIEETVDQVDYFVLHFKYYTIFMQSVITNIVVYSTIEDICYILDYKVCHVNVSMGKNLKIVMK